jgi:CysZ protein
MNEFLRGLKDYYGAQALVRKHHMWPLLLVPGLVSLLYFPLVVFFTSHYADDVAVYLRDHWFPSFLKQRAFLILIVAALWVLGLYLAFILFRNVIMILYAPVLGLLSAKTEEYAGGELPKLVAETTILDAALRGIGMSLLSLGLSVSSLALCVPLLLIPVLGGVVVTVFLTATQMFLAGHGFMDPAWERHRYGIGQSFRLAWQNRLRVLGCGCGFMLLTAFPIVGWFLGPTLGIVAGTLGAVRLVSGARRAAS